MEWRLLDVTVNGNNVQTITLQQGAGPEQFYISVDSSDILDLIYSPGIGQKRTVM